ncbi:MAG: ABC transporter permease, partial [Chloroflexi bacterium]|nr:ABC transporter permease [Chloroflexota bacterium]
MTRYLVKRLITAVFVVILVAVATFSLARILPGDVVIGQIADAGTVRKEDIDRIRAILGLDVPFHVQFWNWIKGLAVGDWGRSLVGNKPTLEQVSHALPVTAELGAISLVIALIIAIPVGIISALRADS